MSTHTLNFPGADINTTQLTVGTGGLSVNSSALRVDASASRVGIGILTPQHTLDVVGDINTTGGIFADSNVGIGTATARYTLDINGDLNFSGSLYQGASPFAGSPWNVSGSDISYTTGNVGIGGAAGTEELKVTGDVLATGDITAFSDERYKTNIEKVQNPLEKIEKVSGYTYEMKDDLGTRKTGVLAQEIMKVLPEVVHGTEDTTYSVAYGNMASLFIEAIKELKNRIDILEAKVQ